MVLEGDGSPASSTTFLRWRARGAEERFADGGELTAVVLREGALVEEWLRPGVAELTVPAGRRIDLVAVAGQRRALGQAPALEAGRASTQQLTLPTPRRLLRGRLLDPDGAPVGATHVAVGPATTVTRLDGTFELSLAQVSDRVTLAVEGWPGLDATLPDTEDRLDLTLVQGASLLFAVEDGANLHLELRDEEGESWRTTVDEEGGAEFHALPAGTPLWLEVRRPSGPEAWSRAPGQLVLLEPTPMVLAPGEVRERRLEQPGPGPIAGRLVDLEGVPLVQVELCLAETPRGEPTDATYLSHAHAARAHVVTDQEGRFRFDEVPGGVWLVGVSRGAWNTKSRHGRAASYAALPVTAGTEGLELRLAVGLELRGRVAGLEGRVRVEARPQAFEGVREAFTRQDGTFVVDRLMPGPHDLYVDGQLLRRGLDPAEPQVELTLDLDG